MFEYDCQIKIEIKCPDCGQANCNGMGLWKKPHEPLAEKPEWLKKKHKALQQFKNHPKRGKCPCGGYYQDWHSHASDCIALGGDVDYGILKDMPNG